MISFYDDVNRKTMMKVVALAAATTLSLAGCGKGSTPDATEGLTLEPVKEETNKDNIPQAEEPEKPEQGKLFLKAGKNKNVVFSFDENGEKTGEYDLDEISEKTKDSDTWLEPYSFVAVDDGILYYSIYTNAGSGEYAYSIYAYDPANGDKCQIRGGDTNCFYPSIDFYKGKIDILVASNGDPYSWEVKCYEKNQDKLAFTETEPEHKDFYEAFSQYNVNYIERLCRKQDGPERILDETGYMIGRKDEKYYILSLDKKATLIEEVAVGDGGIVAFDKDRIIYSKYKGEYSYEVDHYYYKDLETGRTDGLGIATPATFLSYSDGRIIYYSRNDEEYGHDEIRLCAYDVAEDAITMLGERQVVPGVHYYNPVVDNYSFVGNKAYFTDAVDGNVKVFTADFSKDVFEEESLDLVVERIGLFDYGTVGFDSYTFNCPYCGRPLNQDYSEYMVFDGAKVQNADKINAVLKSYSAGMCGSKKEITEYDGVNADGCDHDEEYSYFKNTNDNYVDSVCVIENRYIVIDMKGYWYGGGAHGMPTWYQYAFDMTTGEEVKFADFYNGTDEDLKAIVATKVKEDYEACDASGNGIPYFAASADEAYNTAYEYTSINSGNAFLTPEGITYIFYPYDLASYADGFKEYRISYEEIFGRNTLTP